MNEPLRGPTRRNPEGLDLTMIEAIALVIGVPTVLMALIVLLGKMESAFVRPPERAAELTKLLATADDPDEIEQAAERLFAEAAPVGPRTPREARSEEASETREERRSIKPTAEATPSAA